MTYKVLLVDDEPIILSALRKIIDWEALGFSIVGEAQNGIKALEMVPLTMPDLIISDMKMPGFDGIDMLKSIQMKKINTKVVFLSAYSDFTYMHNAIKYGAFDYLLKPLDSKELVDVIIRFKDINNTEKFQMGQKRQTTDIDGFKEHFLKSYYTPIIVDRIERVPQVFDYNMRFNYKNYFTFAVSAFECSSEKDQRQIWQNDMLEKVAMYIAGQICGLGISSAVFENSIYSTALFVIIGYNDEVFDVYELIKPIHEYISLLTGKDITIGIGPATHSFNDISYSCKCALNALHYRKIAENNCVISYNDVSGGIEKLMDFSEIERSFLASFELCNYEEMNYNIKELFESIRKNPNVSFRQVYKLCYQLLILSERILVKYGLSFEKILNEDVISIDYIASRGSLQYLEKWFLETMNHAMEKITDYRCNNIGHIVDEIIRFINTHLQEDISLSKLSSTFHINKSYLSALFKKRTGMTFTDYITGIKMKKAGDLLRNSSIKVYEISEYLAYNDVKYFSKLFSKYYGISPSDYRKTKK